MLTCGSALVKGSKKQMVLSTLTGSQRHSGAHLPYLEGAHSPCTSLLSAQLKVHLFSKISKVFETFYFNRLHKK